MGVSSDPAALAGASDAANGGSPPQLADALRALRHSRRLTLQQVGRATSISPSFLSLVEKGKSDITIGRLVRLVEFYGTTLADLIPMAPVLAEPEVVRVDERRRISSPAEGIDIYMLAPDMERTMMPMLLEFAPSAHLAEPGRHQGEEWVYVLDGRLCLTLKDSEPRYLEAGESAYYPAERPHLFGNPDPKRRLRIICVDSPPVL
jgi:transcriptional regulator with XRE-family HTH domain